MKMNILPYILLLLVIGCAYGEKPKTEEELIALAREHVAKTSPQMDVSQKPPQTTFFEDAKAWGGGPLWVIGFAVPAPKDKDGKVMGVRPYWSLSVWIKPDGTIMNCAVHTP